MTYIIMNPTTEEAVADQMAHQARLVECRALFSEALRRGKVQRDTAQFKRTDTQIIVIAIRTLAMNGFTRREIEGALAGCV